MADQLTVFPSANNEAATLLETAKENPRRERGKFRFSRGPLRWWLVMVGLLATETSPTRLMIGSAIILVGAILHVCSKAILTQNQELTQGSLYRFTRNPFYLATLIAEAGLLLVIGQWWVAIPYLILWGVIYDRTIRSEESFLSQKFGDAHKEYVRQVPRFFMIPGRGLPAAKVCGPRFSWTNRNIVSDAAFVRASRLLTYPLVFFVAEFVRTRGLSELLTDGRGPLSAVAGILAIHAAAHVLTKIMQGRARRESTQVQSAAPSSEQPLASRKAA